MQTAVALLLITTLLATPLSYASMQDAKVLTVKALYEQAKEDAVHARHQSEFDALYAYADSNLKKTIKIFELSNKNQPDGSLNECGNQGYYGLRLTVGNGYSIEEVDDFDFKMLNNGNVRAIMKFDFQDTSTAMAQSPTAYRDFKLSCQADRCQITDIVDSNGKSATNGIRRVCQP